MPQTETALAQPSGQDRIETQPAWRQSVFRLRRAAFRKFPQVFRDPEYQQMLTISREHDLQDNANTTPPDDERIELQCVWTIEFYTPSHIDGLLGGLSTLGWNRHDDGIAGRDPVLWVRNIRERTSGGGWLNLGVIERPGKSRFLGARRSAPLPEGVEYALGQIFALTSSITCVAICFVVAEDQSTRLDAALRSKRETYFVRKGRGYSIFGPSSQKRDAIDAIRANIRASTADWFRKHLPGLFSSGVLNGEFPTAELVTLRAMPPFPQRQEGGPRTPEYLHLLDVDYDVHAWDAVEIPGLKFSWPSMRDQRNRFHAILAAAETDLQGEKLQPYGDHDRSSKVFFVNEHVQGLLSRWALLALLAGYERHLNAIRDSATFRPAGREKPLRQLGRLSELISRSADMAAVSSELRRATEPDGRLDRNVETFKPCDVRFYKDKQITLGKSLANNIADRAAWLEAADRSVRDLLGEYAAILSAYENLKRQRQIRRLTVIMLALTIVTVWFAAENSKYLPGVLSCLSNWADCRLAR